MQSQWCYDPSKLPRNQTLGSASIEPTKKSQPYSSNPATIALREQAQTAIKKKNMQQAVRLLERALRIDARDPSTYYVFAQLRKLQDNKAAALQLIDKGLSLRPGAELSTKLQALRAKLSGAIDS